MNETATPTTVQAAPVEDEQARSLLADLLESSKLYHTTEDYQALLAFVSKLRNFAPFNAMLLHRRRLTTGRRASGAASRKTPGRS